jgi:multicomponent Na+:H+ antiporter subunit A
MKLRPSPILEHGVVATAGPMLVFSLYLLLAGHNQPGGGFAGGLVAGVTVVLAWAAGGPDTVRRIVPFRSSALLGLGLVVATLTGFASLFGGSAFLESGYLEQTLPLVGKVKVVSALGFDIGVYLVVVGMSLGLVRALGDEPTSDGANS